MAVYGAQSLGNPTHMYVYLGHDTVDQRLIPDSYYTNHIYHHHHKSSFSDWYEIEHLFNRYGRNKHQSGNGQVAYINGHRVKIGTSISGAIVSGHHYSTDNSGLKAIRYAISRPVYKHYKSYRHARKHYRKAKKHARKHAKRNNKKRVKKYMMVTRKAHHKAVLCNKPFNHKVSKNANKSYKQGAILGNYINTTPYNTEGSTKEALKLITTPFNASSKEGFMKNAINSFRSGDRFASNNQIKQRASNSLNAWKHIWQNHNNFVFSMGISMGTKTNLGAYGSNEAVYMDPSMREYQNNPSYKDGYLTANNFTLGFNSNNSQDNKIYSNYVDDYSPVTGHFNY